jgi:hypothetical protein
MMPPNHCYNTDTKAWTKWDNKASGNTCGKSLSGYPQYVEKPLY